jgi:nucleotide-binding universal stress UspA family protein
MFKKILCATDLNPRSLNAIKITISLAEKYNSLVKVLNVQENFTSKEEMMMSRVSTSKIKEDNAKIANKAKKQLDILFNSLDKSSDNIEILLREGKAEKEIVETAEELGIDLIVMGTNGTDVISDYFLGNTATIVVKKSHCPVLVIPNIK